MLADKLKQQVEGSEHNASQGGDWFKFSEGDNRFRILTEPEVFFEKFKVGICYTDCGYQGTPKSLVWILDRKDNKLKLAKLPYMIAETIAKYETDEDFSFSGFPMPYDIKVNAKNAGTKEVTYTVLPSPVKELDGFVAIELAKQKTPKEIIERMKEKKKEEHMKDGSFQKRQEEKAQLKAEQDAFEEAQKESLPTIDYPEPEEPNFG